MSKVVSGRLKKHPSKIVFTFLLVPHSNMFAKVLFNQTPLKKKRFCIICNLFLTLLHWKFELLEC